MLESDHKTTSSSEPEPVDIINDKSRIFEGLIVKNKIKRLLMKMNSGDMSTLDWRLVYGVLEKNFRKQDTKANLQSELAHTTSSRIVHRLKRFGQNMV
jgi:hypothetical protein